MVEDRACGTASITASNCFFIYLGQASVWQKGSFLKLSIYFSIKQWWDIHASYLIAYIFSCCKRSTGGDQGSCWSHTVNNGVDLMSCCLCGWQKHRLNSSGGCSLLGAKSMYLLSPGVGGDCCALSLLCGLRETTSYNWSWEIKSVLHLLQGTFLAVDLAFLGAGAQTLERRKFLMMCLKCQWCAFTFSNAEPMGVFWGSTHIIKWGLLVPSSGRPKCCVGL